MCNAQQDLQFSYMFNVDEDGGNMELPQRLQRTCRSSIFHYQPCCRGTGKAVSMARTEVHTVICSLRHQLRISYLTRLKHVVRPGVSYFQYEKEAIFSFSSVSKARA